MATAVVVLCCLAALGLRAAALPVAEASAEVTSVVPSAYGQGSNTTGDNVIPLLSQFTGQDPLEEEWTEEAVGGRQKRTYCKKCGYGGGRWGGYRRSYVVVVPQRVVYRPVYYYRRPNYCDPCARRNYGGGGGGGSYAESYSYSRSYSWGK